MLAARRELRHRIHELRRIPVLASCRVDELERVDQLGTTVVVRAGTTLTVEGSAGQEFFLLLGGTAVVEREGRRFATLAGGSIAGEMALLDHTARTATVVAQSPMQLRVLTASEFDELLSITPHIESGLLGIARARRRSNASCGPADDDSVVYR